MPGNCLRCKEEVHVAEEKLALESSWHLECFTCAICNKTLDSTNIHECRKANEIYCRSCYNKYFCIPGYGYGPTKPTLLSVLPGKDVSGSGVNCGCSPCCPCDTTEGQPEPDEIFVQPPSYKGQEYATHRPIPRHYTKQVVLPNCPCMKCDKENRTESENRGPNPRVPSYNLSYLRENNEWCKRGGQSPEVKRPEVKRPPPQFSRQEVSSPLPSNGSCQSSRRDSPAPWSGGYEDPEKSYAGPPQSAPCACTQTQKKGRGSRRRSRAKSIPRVNPICQKCGKDVFFAEQVMGYRGYYHIRCFVCYCCGKTLDSTTVNEHRGQLYCKGCYKHKYATIGVGYGVGAGTLQTP